MPNLFDNDDSTGFLLDFRHTVLESYWSSPADQAPEGKTVDFDGAEKTRLYWLVRVDEVYQDYDGDVPETQSLNMSTGSGWWPEPTDETIVRHEDDDNPEKPKLFKSSSFIGQFIGLVSGKQDKYKGAKITVKDGGDEVEYDMTPALQYLLDNDMADPRDATIWVGTQWRNRGLAFDYSRGKKDEDDEREVRARSVPVAFLGVDPEVAQGDKDWSGKQEQGPAESNVTVGTIITTIPTEEPITEAQAQELAQLVETSPNHSQFMRSALMLDWVKEDDTVKAAVMNKADGPWSLR